VDEQQLLFPVRVEPDGALYNTDFKKIIIRFFVSSSSFQFKKINRQKANQKNQNDKFVSLIDVVYLTNDQVTNRRLQTISLIV
jgi:hypothetical protein